MATLKRTFTLTLPYPPSINHYWRRVGARTLLSREGRRYRERVRAIALEQAVDPVDSPCELEVFLLLPDHRRRDVDNVLKALLDGLEHGGVLADDALVKRLAVEKRGFERGGKAMVKVREL